MVQGLTEEELAIFDLLTQPEPVLDLRRKAAAVYDHVLTMTTSASLTQAVRQSSLRGSSEASRRSQHPRSAC